MNAEDSSVSFLKSFQLFAGNLFVIQIFFCEDEIEWSFWSHCGDLVDPFLEIQEGISHVNCYANHKTVGVLVLNLASGFHIIVSTRIVQLKLDVFFIDLPCAFVDV